MTDKPLRDQLRAAMLAEQAARQAEEDTTDAGKPALPPARIRTRPEPVHTAKCKHCGNPFWFKRSHGKRVHNGRYASWRVKCGWCDRPQYIPVDEDDDFVDEPVLAPPREEDL